MAHHGNTPAAWTTVVTLLIGFVIGGVGVVVQSPWTIWIGVAFAPLSLVLGKIMQTMGYGAMTTSRSRS